MKKTLKRTITLGLVGILLIIFASFGLIALTYYGFFGHLPTRQELKEISNEQATLVYSNDGELIGKFFSENRTNINFEDLPGHLVDALVSTEDKRFFQHHGIDRRSYIRVLIKTILLGDESAGGGSTISQQLAKNLYGRRSYGIFTIPVSKIREAFIASRLESVYSKDDILLLYFNSVPFGEDVYGIEAAANRYFDKHTRDLEVQQSAMLVGLLKANTYYNPRLNPENAIRRRNQVLRLMEANGALTEAQADSLCGLPLGTSYQNLNRDSGYEYFVYQVKKKARSLLELKSQLSGKEYNLEKDGLRIYTTLDSRIQKLALEAVSKHLENMQKLLDKDFNSRMEKKSWEVEYYKTHGSDVKLKQPVAREIFTWDSIKVSEISPMDSLWHYYSMLNGAVLAASPDDGSVLVWVGGNNYRFLPYDLVMARHQVASAIKPFVYATAIEEGMEPCTYLENYPREYKEFEGWKPENYDLSATKDSNMAMWYALAHSVNIPTVDLLFRTGYDNVRNVLTDLGFEVPVKETPAIALGAVDASLYQMVKAYSTFANNGSQPADLLMIQKITDASGNVLYEASGPIRRQVLDSYTADMITTMLTQAINSGTGTRIRTQFGISSDMAGKTGTAQKYSDAWFMSYTPGIVIGTWVGCRSPEMHFHSGLGSGSSLALPISGYILQKIEKNGSLSGTYLKPFPFKDELVEMLDCDPYRETGIKGLFDRLGPKSDRKQRDNGRNVRPPQDDNKGVKGFFKKIFGKKDKK